MRQEEFNDLKELEKLSYKPLPSKRSFDQIKLDAELTKKLLLVDQKKGKKNRELSVKSLLVFCDDVLTLCAEIKRLKKRSLSCQPDAAHPE